uniref:Myotubularin related protein 12 n=1 Tax=Latimeria chalumnae TaxID=7897 RepID=H2ZS65_LATCH
KQQAMMFDVITDWQQELKRTHGNITFKAVNINEGYKVSKKTVLYFECVAPIADSSFQEPFGQFNVQIWCWSHNNGSALLKMSEAPKEQDENLQIYKGLMDRIPHGVLEQPPYGSAHVEELSASLPSLQEIQAAYCRFKQLFLIDNTAEFWDSDLKWFSSVENSNWLEVIRQCLKKVIDVIRYLENTTTYVVLLVEDSCDLCCVISSLVQLMMDPYYRTKHGFQSLIQKEWVMGGHCFLDRCNHLRQTEKEEVPIFLLFLDCVWQLLQQYPPAFEFTETYLTVLSDSLYIPIFSTFFFNTPFQRDEPFMADKNQCIQSNPLSYSTVWDWSLQFEPKAQALFKNPLYVEKPKQDKTVQKSQRPKHQRQLSLPLTPNKPSPKKSFFRDEADNFMKTFLGRRISKLINFPEELQNDFREFYEDWHSKPVDLHGILLPHIEGLAVRVWAQRYLRWIPEAQILGGGTFIATSRVFQLMEEIQSLQGKLDEKQISTQLHSEGSEVFSVLHKSRFSSSFPFASLQRHSFKPVIPTNIWRSSGSDEDLAIRDDESVDLGEI